jgi:hypothetical protein
MLRKVNREERIDKKEYREWKTVKKIGEPRTVISGNR